MHYNICNGVVKTLPMPLMAYDKNNLKEYNTEKTRFKENKLEDDWIFLLCKLSAFNLQAVKRPHQVHYHISVDYQQKNVDYGLVYGDDPGLYVFWEKSICRYNQGDLGNIDEDDKYDHASQVFTGFCNCRSSE